MMDASYKERDRTLEALDYRRALMVQSACNLSGVVHDFSTSVSRIWKEAQLRRKGTDWVNQHPICRLYAEQIYHLATGGKVDDVSYFEAFAVCEEKSKDTVAVEEDDGYPD